MIYLLLVLVVIFTYSFILLCLDDMNEEYMWLTIYTSLFLSAIGLILLAGYFAGRYFGST